MTYLPEEPCLEPGCGSGLDADLDELDGVVVEAAQRRFRTVLGHYASGITVVTSVDDGEPVGMTCQSFSSVSLEPPLVLFVVSRTSRAWPRIRRAGHFAVNLLGASQEQVSHTFASPAMTAAGRFADVAWTAAPVTGSPLLPGVIGWVDCSIHAVHEAGDHDIVVGRVHAMDHSDHEGPLLYFRSGYRTTDGA